MLWPVRRCHEGACSSSLAFPPCSTPLFLYSCTGGRSLGNTRAVRLRAGANHDDDAAEHAHTQTRTLTHKPRLTEPTDRLTDGPTDRVNDSLIHS